MIKEEREANWEVESNEYGWKAELREQKRNDLLSKAEEWENQNYAEIETGLVAGEGLTLTVDLESDWKGPMCEVFRSDEYKQHFVMYNDDGNLLIDVDLTDGSVEYGEAYSPDEAAQTFWDTIGKIDAKPVEQCWGEYESAEQVLRTVRHNLGVPEGESIVEYSAQFSAPPGIADDMPLYSEDVLKRVDQEGKTYIFDKAMDGLIDG